ncbi:MAG TPA: pitrilysin family protein [Polyangiaceae bacterium]
MNGSLPVAAPQSRVLVETSHDLPLISLSIGSKRGGLFDPEGQEGLTRLSARLMRRTGGGREPQEIDTRIDSIGASLGVDVSASTVVFHASSIRRSISELTDIVADVLARPGLAEDELGRLKRETEAELVEALDDDRGLARRWFRRKLFPSHPYGRPLSGTPETLARISRASVQAQAASIAARGELLFAFAGDIEQAEADRLVARIESGLPDGRSVIDPTPEPASVSGRRLIIVDKPERTQTQILIGALGTHPSDEDHTALLVGNTIFGGTFTARLTQEIRAKRGWSYGAYSSLPVDRRRQSFSLWTFPKTDDAAACIRLQLDMLKELRERGVTAKELAWAKRYLVRSHAFAVDTPSKRAGLLLEASLYDLPPRYYDDYLARVSAVKLDDVNQALARRVPEKDLLVVVVGTANDLRASVEGAIEDLAETEIVRYDLAV